MQAEYLNLVANVQDQFTSDLMELGTMLEAVGQQADRLSPIRIRVNVHDQQVDNLLAKMGMLEGVDMAESIGGRVDHDVFFDESIGDFFDESPIDDSALDDLVTERAGPMSVGNVNQMIVGNVGQAVFADGATRGAAGGTARTSAALPARSSAATRSTATTDGGPVRLISSDIDMIKTLAGERTLRNILINDDIPITEALDPMSDADFLRPTEESISKHLGIDADQIARATDWTGMRRVAADRIRHLDVGSIKEMGLPSSIKGDIVETSHGPMLSYGGLASLSRARSGDLRGMGVLGMHQTDYVNQKQLRRITWIDSFLEMRIGMTQFYDFLAALMPMLMMFIGALPVAITALGGLATAAFGAAGGLGAIAALGLTGLAAQEAGGAMPGLEEFGSLVEDLPEQIFATLAPLAKRMAPTAQRGLEGIEWFFDELAMRGDALLHLRDEAVSFGRWVVPFVANTLQMLGLLANATDEVFGMIAASLDNRQIILGLADALADALPYLASLATLIMDALPGIMAWSRGMLMAANAMLKLISVGVGFLTTLLEIFPWVDEGAHLIGKFSASLMALTTVMFMATKIYAIYTSALVAKIAHTIKDTIVTGENTVAQQMNNAATSQGTLTNWAYNSSLVTLIASKMQATLATLGLVASLTALKWAIIGVLAVTGIGLVVAGIGLAFDQMASNVDEATASLEEFQDEYRALDGGRPSFGGGMEGGYVDYTWRDANDEMQASTQMSGGGQTTNRREVVYNVSDNRQTTIEAPDRETGEELAQYNQFTEGKTRDLYFS